MRVHFTKFIICWHFSELKYSKRSFKIKQNKFQKEWTVMSGLKLTLFVVFLHTNHELLLLHYSICSPLFFLWDIYSALRCLYIEILWILANVCTPHPFKCVPCANVLTGAVVSTVVLHYWMLWLVSSFFIYIYNMQDIF